MRVTLTKSAILGYARRAGLLGAARSDCAIEYSDGLDVEGALIDGIRCRYLALVDTGTREQLAPDDIAATAAVGEAIAGGGVRIVLPAGTRRVFDVALEGWGFAVAVCPPAQAAATVARQLNPFTAATAAAPVAVAEPAAAGEIHSILCWPSAAAVKSLTAVIPEADRYSLDEAAIALILPPSITDILKL